MRNDAKLALAGSAAIFALALAALGAQTGPSDMGMWQGIAGVAGGLVAMATLYAIRTRGTVASTAATALPSAGGWYALLVVITTILAVFVWPTRYRYDSAGENYLRMDRFTGKIERLTKTGWRPLATSAPDAIAPPPSHTAIAAPAIAPASMLLGREDASHVIVRARSAPTDSGTILQLYVSNWSTKEVAAIELFLDGRPLVVSSSSDGLEQYMPARLRGLGVPPGATKTWSVALDRPAPAVVTVGNMYASR